MRARPAVPTSVPEEEVAEDPMSIDQNDIPEEPMAADEPLFLARPVPRWIRPLMSYMLNDILPEDEVAARKVQRKSKAYTIINNEMYKRSVTGVLQRCIEPQEG